MLASAGWSRGVASTIPRGFDPGSAAAVGSRDYWVLGEYRCAGSWCQALVRSTDAGKHFTRVSAPPSPPQGTVTSLAFANARDGFAYVLGGHRLFVTRDGGESWHRTGPDGQIEAFALGGGDAYAVVGHVLVRSAVGRIAWRRLALPASHLPASLAARGSDVWFLGPPRHRPDFDTIGLSSDRGHTFTTRKGPCLSELGGGLVPAAGGVVWAVCPTGNMGELSLSRNGGRSFPTISSVHDPGGLRQPGLTNGGQIAAASASVAVLSRGGGGALLRTTDTGRHWSSVPGTARIADVFWLAFTTKHVGAAIVQIGTHQALWRTTDSGATWHSVVLR